MIRIAHIDDVAEIIFRNPPVNALSVGNGLVGTLGKALRQALSDSRIRAIVLGSEGKYFSAGADLADLNNRQDTLDCLRWLTSDVIEDADKPIIVAVQGPAFGGGLELALAGHYRICSSNAQFALPEVKLGILPGAGGTQRLPRLVGATFALEMMLSGKMIDANLALDRGLVDRVARGDLIQEAVEFASTWAELGPRRTREMACIPDKAQKPNTAEFGHATLNRAPAYIARCVDAALSTPFLEGMALERKLFEELRTSEASVGLRHAFWSRREVGKIPGISDHQSVEPIKTVAVIGAGLMGTGIATTLINAGLKVELVEANSEIIDRAFGNIRGFLQRDVKKGRISPGKASERISLLSRGQAMSAAAQADLIIEAVYEDMEVKRRVFLDVDRLAKPSAILATNTSTLDLNEIASFTNRPDQVVGLHFFSPANIMKLVEVVRGDKTSQESLASALRFVKAVGKIGVVSGVCDGFIGNRMFEEYLRQAYFLLEEGALPYQVDAALEAFGMAMGPFKVMDLAGQDVGWSIRKRRAIEQPDRPYSKIPDLICELGRYGQKSGAGFYLYSDGRTPQIDPFIDTLITGYSKSVGAPRRKIEDTEIVERCIFALVNEGAKLLGEKVAYRSLDIDVVYIDGYGFPETRGGPMFFADRYGLRKVLGKLMEFGTKVNGWAWTPAPLLVELAQEGRNLATVSNIDV